MRGNSREFLEVSGTAMLESTRLTSRTPTRTRTIRSPERVAQPLGGDPHTRGPRVADIEILGGGPMRTSLSQLWYAVFALAALVGFGCSGGDSLHPVTGKVTYKGQAVPRALVTLHPKGNNDPKVERPIGLTKEDGTFTVMTGQKEG